MARLLELYGRAIRQRCPRCGEGRLFAPWSLRMHEKCTSCGFDFRREPGFYLGSIYVNYGITSAAVVITYLWLAFGMQAEMPWRIGVCLTIAIILPLALFRHSRSVWLAFDSLLDRSE